MKQLSYRVVERRQETTDTATLTLAPTNGGIGAWTPGQFTLIRAGDGAEAPLAISGGGGDRIRHTVRDAGAVTRAIATAPIGTTLELRGPYGQGWDLARAYGRDLVILGGGMGLAPLRPVITEALAHRDRYRRVVVLVGARTPADLLYSQEYGAWRSSGAQVLVTVDRAQRGWRGAVGVITGQLPRASFTPAETVACVCGPELMMRFAAQALSRLGVPDKAIQVSLERHMECAIGRCGHGSPGSALVCREGPVADWERAAPLLSVAGPVAPAQQGSPPVSAGEPCRG